MQNYVLTSQLSSHCLFLLIYLLTSLCPTVFQMCEYLNGCERKKETGVQWSYVGTDEEYTGQGFGVYIITMHLYNNNELCSS